ncbi:hypothetical protein ACQWG0_25385, partial [Salmonella enterica subsp. enterica serovar Infantis]
FSFFHHESFLFLAYMRFFVVATNFLRPGGGLFYIMLGGGVILWGLVIGGLVFVFVIMPGLGGFFAGGCNGFVS